MGKRLAFENGEPVDACNHDVIDAEGANPVCWKCGEINPEDDA